MTGASGLAYSLFALFTEPARLNWMLFLACLVLVTSYTKAAFPCLPNKSFLSHAVVYCGAVVLGPWAGTLLAAIDGLGALRHAKRKIKTVLHAVALALAVLNGSFITAALFGPIHALAAYGSFFRFAIAVGFFGVTVYAIKTVILTAEATLRRGTARLLDRLVGYFQASSWVFVAVSAGGLLGKTISLFGVYAVAFLASVFLLNYFIYRAYLRKVRASRKQIDKLNRLHLATIESLALAIDAHDQMAQGHIRRVRALAEELARAISYPEDQMEGLKAAALLHDIGKLAVPEHILNKPGKLSPAEFSKVMIHPVVAADILSSVEFPYEVVPIVKHHHEKYDGTGYPSGLKGVAIPLGARILTIADCYDALNSARPHRPPYSKADSVNLMRLESGRMFDPVLLEVFFGLVEVAERNGHHSIQHSHSVALPRVEPQQPGNDILRVDSVPKSAAEKALLDISAAQREVLSLYEISQTLGSALRLSDVLPIIAAKLENVASFTTLIIYLAEGDSLRVAYVTGKHAETLKGGRIRFGEGEAGWVAANRKSVIGGSPLADLSRPLGLLEAEAGEVVVGRAGVTDLASLGTHAAAYRSTAIFPLVRDEVLVGTLALYSDQERGYSADEVRLLETISGHAAVAVYNALAFERTEESALTDSLTGLPNSRYLYSFFDQERSRAERQASYLALMMMDLDGFKKINDTYGHHIGDEILRRTAKIIRRRLRSGDILIRYAGDEFVAVLHHATPEAAADLKLRLQSAVDGFAHEVRPGRVARIGISIGYSTYGHDGFALEELMEAADERMYQDKVARRRSALTLNAAPATVQDIH